MLVQNVVPHMYRGVVKWLNKTGHLKVFSANVSAGSEEEARLKLCSVPFGERLPAPMFRN